MREKYPKCPKTHKVENSVLIAEEENKIHINSGVSNVYKFLHADFEGVSFTQQGDMFIWQRREDRKTSLSVMNMKKTMKSSSLPYIFK